MKQLIEAEAIEALTEAMWSEQSVIVRRATAALERIVSEDDVYRKKAVKNGVLEAITMILLKSDPMTGVNVVRDLLDLLHQIAACGETCAWVCALLICVDALHRKIISAGVLPVLSKTSVTFLGQFYIQKECLSTIVRILSSTEQKGVALWRCDITVRRCGGTIGQHQE